MADIVAPGGGRDARRVEPAVSGERCYFAFISYSHQDRTWADWLHKALETWTVPVRLVGRSSRYGAVPRRLAPIFRDRDELPSATDLSGKVNEALRQSARLVVICSPRSAASRWVNEEVLAFKRLGRGDRVFCLIVDGEPGASTCPGHEADECFAPALRHDVDAEGKPTGQPVEPIAADARPGQDGKAHALLKLIAGMLDIGFDELRQREQQRRHRRMVALTALALVVMAVTSTLAVTAVIARNAAVAARQTAERRQKQAEDLVGFMLGDLNDKLREVNRLDILRSVDDKAMAYFATLPRADVNDTSLAQRATALQKIGGVHMDGGELSQALEAFRLALDINRQRVRQQPGDPERETAYGESLTWVGFALWQQGDLDGAQRGFSEAIAALDKADAVRPDNADIELQLAYAHNNLGQVLRARGHLQVEHVEYTREVALFRKLMARDPKNSEYAIGLGSAEGNLGNLALQQGDLVQAVATFMAQRRIFDTLVAQNPRNHDFAESLVISHALLGNALYMSGQTEQGLHHIGEAVRRADALVQFDPDHASWRNLWALYAVSQARWMREAVTASDTRARMKAARAALEQLMKKSPADVEARRNYAMAQVESARVAMLRGRKADARRDAEAALVALEHVLSRHANDVDALRTACEAELVLAGMAPARTAAPNASVQPVPRAMAEFSLTGSIRTRDVQADVVRR